VGSIESLLVPGYGGVLITGDLMSHVNAVMEDMREGGAITAALEALGVPPDDAAALEQAVADGQTLVVVHGEYDPRSARAALQLADPGTSA
jgi:hypothetical protein